MYPTTARVDPEEVLVTILIANGFVKNPNGSGNEPPTSFTYTCVGTACTYRIVVGHVYIKNEFPLQGFECARSDGFLVFGLRER